MTIRETVRNPQSGWMKGDGPQRDILISSRVRVARNLKEYAFPHLLQQEEAEQVIYAVGLALNNQAVTEQAGKLEVTRMSELSSLERQILVEKHLISPDLLEEHYKKAVALQDDETISIMINEEDHLRIQCLLPGLQLERAWSLVDQIDNGLESTLNIAFDEEFGYLTACPTNVGTGMRASVMLHLPGLVLVDQVNAMLEIISKLGFAVRGLYGEGTEALGNLFQISNQVTMGHTEEEIINSLKSITSQVLNHERESRRALLKKRGDQLEDKIGRSYGLLKHAHLMSAQEAMRRLSDVRLGVDLELIKGPDAEQLTELLVLTRQAYLMNQQSGSLNPMQLDRLRSQVIRDKLC